ncbi:MAG: exo-alpha-sialidase [Clostridiales bacterium]|nr:exo-alpha-sialidase [Clostridiales bacterium]
MKHLDTQPARIVCNNPDSVFGYFGWPSVARLPDGTLAVAASGFRLRHVCPFGKGVICYSRDEGRTWTRPAVVIDTVLDDRDCGIVPFGNGRVMLTSFNNTIAVQRRWNAAPADGESPGRAAERAFAEAYLNFAESTGREAEQLGSNYVLSEDGGYTFGPLQHVPVTAPHGPCPTRDGGLLYIGRRFSADDSFDDGATPFVECWKLNGKDAFERLSGIPNISDEHGLLDSCEPHAIELPDGKILVHIRVQRGGQHPEFTLYQSESTDGGHTFTAPVRLLPPQGGSPAHLLLHSSGGLISAYGHCQPPYGIRVMFSRDQGKTWDTNWTLSDDGESQDLGYPATVELEDGTLLTVYYQKAEATSAIYGRVWRMPEH